LMQEMRVLEIEYYSPVYNITINFESVIQFKLLIDSQML
jgi:hypothetical protein